MSDTESGKSECATTSEESADENVATSDRQGNTKKVDVGAAATFSCGRRKHPNTIDIKCLKSHQLFAQFIQVLESKIYLGLNALTLIFGKHSGPDYMKDVRNILTMTYHPLPPDQKLLKICDFLNETVEFVLNKYLPFKRLVSKPKSWHALLEEKELLIKQQLFVMIKDDAFPNTALLLFTLTGHIYFLFLREIFLISCVKGPKYQNIAKVVSKMCVKHVVNIFVNLWKMKLDGISHATVTKVLKYDGTLNTEFKSKLQIFHLYATALDVCNDKNIQIMLDELFCSRQEVEAAMDAVVGCASDDFLEAHIMSCFEELNWVMHFPVHSSLTWMKFFLKSHINVPCKEMFGDFLINVTKKVYIKEHPTTFQFNASNLPPVCKYYLSSHDHQPNQIMSIFRQYQFDDPCKKLDPVVFTHQNLDGLQAVDVESAFSDHVDEDGEIIHFFYIRVTANPDERMDQENSDNQRFIQTNKIMKAAKEFITDGFHNVILKNE